MNAWGLVMGSTIINCFTKAGFIVNEDALTNIDHLEQHFVYNNIFEKLRDLQLVPDTVTFTSFVTADSELVTRTTHSDEEIVAAVQVG